MPVYIHMNTSARLIHAEFFGDVKAEDIRRGRDFLGSNSSFQPHFSLIVDFTGATSFSLSTDELRALASDPSMFEPSALQVIVAPAGKMRDIALAFQAQAEDVRPNLYVTDTVEKAQLLIEEAREAEV